MSLHTTTWVRKSTGVDVAEVTLDNFLELVKWVGQGGQLTVPRYEEPTIEIYVNEETAIIGNLIVKDGMSFYITTEAKLKEFYNKKD